MISNFWASRDAKAVSCLDQFRLHSQVISPNLKQPCFLRHGHSEPIGIGIFLLDNGHDRVVDVLNCARFVTPRSKTFSRCFDR